MSDFSATLSAASALQKQWNHQERLKLQNAVRKVIPKHRAAACLRHRLGGSSVSVSITGLGQTRLGGLMVCDAHHICPVCHHKKMARDKQTISELVRKHYEDGGLLVDAVLTVPHREGEPLQVVLERLENVWKELRSKPIWKQLTSDLGVVGVIRRLEVTLGPNGWHPHFHVSLMCDWSQATELRGHTRYAVHMDAFAIVSSCWAKAGEKLGLPISMHAQSAVAIVAAVEGQKAVAYNLKNMGYGDKPNSLTPFDLLRIVCQEIAPKAQAAAMRLFAEYADAIHGKHVLSLTGKARLRHQSTPKKPQGDTLPLGRIAPEAWMQLMRLGLREAVAKVSNLGELVGILLFAANAAGFNELPSTWFSVAYAVSTDLDIP